MLGKQNPETLVCIVVGGGISYQWYQLCQLCELKEPLRRSGRILHIRVGRQISGISALLSTRSRSIRRSVASVVINWCISCSAVVFMVFFFGWIARKLVWFLWQIWAKKGSNSAVSHSWLARSFITSCCHCLALNRNINYSHQLHLVA